MMVMDAQELHGGSWRATVGGGNMDGGGEGGESARRGEGAVTSTLSIAVERDREREREREINSGK